MLIRLVNDRMLSLEGTNVFCRLMNERNGCWSEKILEK
jgi:hypothetical protein